MIPAKSAAHRAVDLVEHRNASVFKEHFPEAGVSLEWHRLSTQEDSDWVREAQPGALEICVNFSGSARLMDSTGEFPLAPRQVAIYPSSSRPRMIRQGTAQHHFLIAEIPSHFVTNRLEAEIEKLKPSIRQFLAAPETHTTLLEIIRTPSSLGASLRRLRDLALPGPARWTWALGHLIEILALTIYHADEQDHWTEKYLRLNRHRVEKAKLLLVQDLANPPTLDVLAAEIGCSSSHLSRLFTQETGGSIPKFLREKRLEIASELLRTGKANQARAAKHVGYSSISAFKRAFVRETGRYPRAFMENGIEAEIVK